MHVAVIGSRDWPRNTDLIRRVLNDLWEHVDQDLTLVSGAARGADTIAEALFTGAGMPTLIFPAQWDVYGRSAGYRRNHDIVANADLVLAFQLRGSAGTQHSIDIANQKGVPVIVWNERDL